MAKIQGIYGVIEAARMLGLASSTVRNLAAEGAAGFKVEGGRDWLFTEADIAKLKRRGAPQRETNIREQATVITTRASRKAKVT